MSCLMIEGVGLVTPGPLLSLDDIPPEYQQYVEVARDPHPVLGTPCWLWIGRLNRNGYARLHSRMPVAHRDIWNRCIRPLPSDLLIDHLCRCRKCVNTHHHEPVTVRVNTLRGAAVLFSKVV